MATLNGNQYKQAYVDVPSSKIKPGDVSGDVKIMFFDFDITAAPTNGDILKLGKIPAGVRVVDLVLSFPDLGTAGNLNVGWAASANGVEAADADGFLATVDVNTAAATVGIIEQANMPGLLKEFAAECDLQIDIATAWTATSGKIKGYLAYVII
jgi:hypothetical protein